MGINQKSAFSQAWALIWPLRGSRFVRLTATIDSHCNLPDEGF